MNSFAQAWIRGAIFFAILALLMTTAIVTVRFIGDNPWVSVYVVAVFGVIFVPWLFGRIFMDGGP